jgi:hypothetical protein
MVNNDMVLMLAEQLHKDCQEAIKAAKEALRILGEMK